MNGTYPIRTDTSDYFLFFNVRDFLIRFCLFHVSLLQPVGEEEEEGERRKTFVQKQIEHPFSLGNINIISDKNAVYERELLLVRVQGWLPQLVAFFFVNRTFLWLFLAVFRGGHDSPHGQGSVCIVFHRIKMMSFMGVYWLMIPRRTALD